MAAVAAEAGVAVETVYSAVGPKRQLLVEWVDRVVAGDDTRAGGATTTSPDVVHLLVHQRGWSHDDIEDWLADALVALLLP